MSDETATGEGGARLDGIEIKVTVGISGLARAMEALGLDPGSAVRRRIWFCDVASAGGVDPKPVLLGERLILRLRETEGKGADSTVKFRPVDPPPLLAHWRHVRQVDGGELRVEGDWVGERKLVSASLVADQGDDEPTEAAAGRRTLDRLFSHKQEEFLHDHATVDVDLNGLRVLGPVAALKWEPQDRGLPRHLAAEHWKVDDLEFLELSVRADDETDATDVQGRLGRALHELGLNTDGVQETKTRTVLEHLIRR